MINLETFNTANIIFSLARYLFLVGCAHAGDSYNTTEEAKLAASATLKICLANDEKNWIVVDGLSREDKTLSFL